MAEVTTETKTEEQEEVQKQQQAQQQSTQNQTQQKENVDVSKVKEQAIEEYLKSLGVDSDDALKGIVTKHKEDEDRNKTELQRSNDTLTTTTKKLAEEREARIMAEAKLSAIQLGAKTELIEDLVVVAKSRVTKDKDINAVIAEIKDSTSGSVYFIKDDEEETEDKIKGKTVTRGRVTKGKKETQIDKKEEEKKHEGTMAERILSKRSVPKKHYFS